MRDDVVCVLNDERRLFQITLQMRRPSKEHVIVPKVWPAHH